MTDTKCKDCVFFVKDGFIDMGFHIDTCKLILYLEKNKSNGDIFNSLLTKDVLHCKYFLNINKLINKTIDKINK